MRWLLIIAFFACSQAQAQRLRDYGVEIGILPTGKLNAIVDVPGVSVGHTTLIEGENVRTGVTAILPHPGNIFQQKVPAAIYIHNGFGKLAGISQVMELGNLETPIILTNTLSVPTAMNAVISYTLALPGNENVRSVNAVVGETNDGSLNDIRGRHVKESHVMAAIEGANITNAQEGNIGAGTGTRCFGYKGGIGTSSRKLPSSLGGYTIGVMVQTNFGGVLEIAGVPIGKLMDNYPFKNALEKSDGSCMIVVLTDAPLDARNLERLAKRASMGLARAGGIASNGSGDYVIAASTNEQVRIPYEMEERVINYATIHNDAMSSLFLAAIEATEEAILNSLFAAETMTGNGRIVEALPKEEVLKLLKEYGRLD
ncbi:MAG: P1 family peptidase [Cyclobacteriaceae bacterium]